MKNEYRTKSGTLACAMLARRQAVFLAGAAAVLPATVFPQAAPRVIGFLSLVSAAENASRLEALAAGLRDNGYIEGRNLRVEYRFADGQPARMAELASELVKSGVQVIVTHGPSGIRAAQQASRVIPIVMAAMGDVQAAGLVANLARPEGNVTGMSFFLPEVSAKRLELLREALPRVTSIGLLLNPDNPINLVAAEAAGRMAQALKTELSPFHVRGRTGFEAAFAAMAKARVGAFSTVDDIVVSTNHPQIAQLAALHRLPSVAGPDFPDAGGWLGYGVDIPELFRRSAYFVDRILKGAKVADLPVEQPTRFDVVVNQPVGKTMNLVLPQPVLVRVQRVIG